MHNTIDGDIVSMILLCYDVNKDKWGGDELQILGFMKKKSNEEIVEEVILEQYNQYYRLAYSYVHNEINKEAFPHALKIYNPAIFTSRGKYKYTYKDSIKSQATLFLQKKLKQYFPNAKILYIA